MGVSLDLLPSFCLADSWDAVKGDVPPLPMAKGSQLDLLDIAPSGECVWEGEGWRGGTPIRRTRRPPPPTRTLSRSNTIFISPSSPFHTPPGILASFDDDFTDLVPSLVVPRSVMTGHVAPPPPVPAFAAAPPVFVPSSAPAASPSPSRGSPPRVSRSGARRLVRSTAGKPKCSPSVWTSSGGEGGSTTPAPPAAPRAAALAAAAALPTRTPKVAVPPSQAVAIAAAAAAAALEGAPPPALGPLKLGKRKAIDLESIHDISERRRQRRLAKNRATAAVSRERKHAQMQALATTVYELQREAAELTDALAARDTEITRLKARLGEA